MICATGFENGVLVAHQWRKPCAPLVDFPYSKLPAAQSCATAVRQWRTSCKLVGYKRGNQGGNGEVKC